ncbi:MAG TPA: hypothetical protein VH351_21060 [Bryobacteraceae bacterium]|jgi:hypothetical protein|nr:hypothetical protein [Bryobacteraceae bacterium]
MSAIKTQDYKEREITLEGWPVRLTSYRFGNKFVCQADNLTPGACLARFSGETPEEAENNAVSKAAHLLRKTQRREI